VGQGGQGHPVLKANGGFRGCVENPVCLFRKKW
jgi:hypothetical protein